MTTWVATYILIFKALFSSAAELTKITNQFIKAATDGNTKALEKLYLDFPTRAAAIAEYKYRPLLCVKKNNNWFVVPWTKQDHLRQFSQQRTPYEQIHLKLFEKWANLIEKQLKKEANENALRFKKEK